MGEDYHHPTWLLILGIIVVIISAYLGITSLGNLATDVYKRQDPCRD